MLGPAVTAVVILMADHILETVRETGLLPPQIEQLPAEWVEELMTASADSRMHQENRVKRVKEERSSPALPMPGLPGDDARESDAEDGPQTPVRKCRRTAWETATGSSPDLTPEPKGKRPSRLAKSAAKAKAACKQKAKTTKQLVKEGDTIAKEHDLTNAFFQSEHYQNGCPPPQGHWHAFLQALSDTSRSLVCNVCSRLRQQCLEGATEEACASATSAASAVAENKTAQEAAVVPYKPPARPMPKGRPRKDEAAGSRFDLRAYLKEHRRDVYSETAKSWGPEVQYYCRSCKRDIKFCRTTDLEKLLKHERAHKHRLGLVALGLGEAVAAATSEAQSAQSQLVEAERPGRCHGVSVTDPLSHLYPMADSFKDFFAAGMPRTVYAPNESDPLANVTFEISDHGNAVRARNCEGKCEARDVACSACVRATKSKLFKIAVAQKAFDMSLCVLCWKALNETADATESYKQHVRSRDFMILGLAGSNFESYAEVKSPLELARKVRSRFDCTPLWRLSESWKSYLDSRLPSASLFCDSDAEATAHNALTSALSTAVLEGRAKELDLRLAARVAAGGLRGEALVQGLVTTFLLQSKQVGLYNLPPLIWNLDDLVQG